MWSLNAYVHKIAVYNNNYIKKWIYDKVLFFLVEQNYFRFNSSSIFHVCCYVCYQRYSIYGIFDNEILGKDSKDMQNKK